MSMHLSMLSMLLKSEMFLLIKFKLITSLYHVYMFCETYLLLLSNFVLIWSKSIYYTDVSSSAKIVALLWMLSARGLDMLT